MNQVILTGNLTRDPEARAVGSTTVVNFSLAVENRYKSGKGDWVTETSFVDCEAWGTGAEAIANNATKGSALLVNGNLKQETWEKEGKKQSKLKIRVNSFELIQKKARQSQGEPVGAAAGSSEGASSGSGSDAPGDDIPF